MAKDKTYQKSANNARKRSNAAKESSGRHWRDLADMKQTAEDAAVKLGLGQNRQRKREQATRLAVRPARKTNTN